ncbi:MAG TPA: hypothetical protein VLI72_00140 [Methylibium sp.]|nr:hypothetical protein [Methylibium sp.]
MRHLLLVLPLLLGALPAAQAQVSVGIGVSVPGVSIGIHMPVYPELQRVPGYPVYYAPQAQGNYFFFDGLYWVFQGDDWYASSWYNGPWRSVARYDVPGYMLRVPVRYYRQPPMAFRAWRGDAPPRWGDHWGGDWQQRRAGWERRDHQTMRAPAPLPDYQRKYPQSRYPQEAGQQQVIRAQNYRYQPREPVARQEWTRTPAMPQRDDPQAAPPNRGRPAAGRDEPAGRGHGKKDEVPGG